MRDQRLHPLIMDVDAGNKEVVRLLLELGAKIEALGERNARFGGEHGYLR
jgi:ankyrin repeat protein